MPSALQVIKIIVMFLPQFKSYQKFFQYSINQILRHSQSHVVLSADNIF